MREYPEIFVSNLFKFCTLGILYNAIMLKNGFGQAFYIDILKRILTKFNLYFFEFYTNFYEYLKFGWILRFKSIRRKKKPAHSAGPPFSPRPVPRPQGSPSHVCLVVAGRMPLARSPRSSHARRRGWWWLTGGSHGRRMAVRAQGGKDRGTGQG
jgi:hypothetical protein